MGAQRSPQPPPSGPTARPAGRLAGRGPGPCNCGLTASKVLPTPAALRDRRLLAVGRLPPPAGGRFRSAVRPISAAVRARMGATWRPGCPVGLQDLRYVTVSFRGSTAGRTPRRAGRPQRAAPRWCRCSAASTGALPDRGDAVGHRGRPRSPPGDGNNTAAFVCRTARKQIRWSAHAYGLAVDVNPFQNPYRRGDLVLPELASATMRTGPGPARHDPARRRRHQRLRRHRLDLGRHLALAQGPDALLGHRELAVPLLGIQAQDRAAAVDRDGGAVDEAGLLRQQVGDHGRDLLGAADPADGMEPAHLVLGPGGPGRALGGQQVLVALGVDRAQVATALTRIPLGP